MDEDIPETTPQNFSDVMPKNIFNEKSSVGIGKAGFTTVYGPSKITKNAEEDFSFVGIKDAVSEKLKDMRTIG